MDIDYFITFGCWNYNKCEEGGKSPGLSMVMHRLLEEDNNFNKIVVLGDNYYPDSIELGKEDKSESKSSKVKKGEKKAKIKKLNKENFYSGFGCLLNVADKLDAQVYLLTGNHETDKLLDDIEYTPETIEKNSTDCLSLQLQKNIVKEYKRFNLVGWDPDNKKKKLSDEGYFDIKHSKEMIYIYLDTNIYEDRDEGDLMCGDSTRKFRKNVKAKIIKELKGHQGKSIIFFGHVPLFTCKNKDGNHVGSLCNNSQLIFTDIFCDPEISKLLSATDYIYYICADTHYYQESMITLTNGIVLTQYIVGSGGAKLDVHSENIDSCLSSKIEKKGKELPVPNTYIDNYIIIQSKDTFGYLKCVVFNGQLIALFKDVDEDPKTADRYEEDYGVAELPKPGGSKKKNMNRKKVKKKKTKRNKRKTKKTKKIKI